MTYEDCQLWKDPAEGHLEMAGALLRDHPNVRAVMQCRDCGQRWLYDFLDSADWGGDGAGRVIYAPLPDAAPDSACGTLGRGEVEALRPRLVVRDYAAGDFERVR